MRGLGPGWWTLSGPSLWVVHCEPGLPQPLRPVHDVAGTVFRSDTGPEASDTEALCKQKVWDKHSVEERQREEGHSLHHLLHAGLPTPRSWQCGCTHSHTHKHTCTLMHTQTHVRSEPQGGGLWSPMDMWVVAWAGPPITFQLLPPDAALTTVTAPAQRGEVCSLPG